ncbi:MAG: histidine--tRNA ligase family protein, partial [Chloroflexi bacterium]|nr:histidine--tRNA ligase family protein [Chloroflexota bacterium]
METLEIQRVRGTNDFVPPDEARLRGITDRLRRVFELYGYQGIETPVLENLDLFLRKSGEEIAARMYSFTHWNRKLCLRPEYTASVMRAYVNHLQDRPLPLRLFYGGPTFRYEKPQRGRYRQFTEVGVECIGGAGPAADAEILRLASRGLETLGIRGYRLVVGHLGVVLQFLRQLGIDEHGQSLILGSMEQLARRRVDKEQIVGRIISLLGGARAAERDGRTDDVVDEALGDELALEDGESPRLTSLFRQYGPEGAARITADLLERANLTIEAGTRTPEEIVRRLLSKASRPDPTGQVKAAASFIGRLSELSGPPSSAIDGLETLMRDEKLDPFPLREIEAGLELFTAHGGAVGDLVVDLSLGRGLRYYTGLVFEMYHDGPGGPLQLCGGGRYDDLVRGLGGREACPAIGFSYGLERLDMVLGGGNVLERGAGAEVLLAPIEPADLAMAMELAERLRDGNVRVELDIRLRGARANLRHADRQNIPLVVL